MWQPIETAPAYKEVLVWPYPSDYCKTAILEPESRRLGINGWYYTEYELGFGEVYLPCKPTHWMPLPDPPVKEAQHDV